MITPRGYPAALSDPDDVGDEEEGEMSSKKMALNSSCGNLFTNTLWGFMLCSLFASTCGDGGMRKALLR